MSLLVNTGFIDSEPEPGEVGNGTWVTLRDQLEEKSNKAECVKVTDKDLGGIVLTSLIWKQS